MVDVVGFLKYLLYFVVLVGPYLALENMSTREVTAWKKWAIVIGLAALSIIVADILVSNFGPAHNEMIDAMFTGSDKE